MYKSQVTATQAGTPWCCAVCTLLRSCAALSLSECGVGL